MLRSSALKICLLISGVLLAALTLGAANRQEEQAKEAPGVPPRAAPADYQAQSQAGQVTIAAEFTGHSIGAGPEQGPLESEDYVVVEAALFGPPEARLRISAEDFTLRING